MLWSIFKKIAIEFDSSIDEMEHDGNQLLAWTEKVILIKATKKWSRQKFTIPLLFNLDMMKHED